MLYLQTLNGSSEMPGDNSDMLVQWEVT